MRRAIWRDAIIREAVSRQISDDILFRLKVATIDGGLGSLDEYLMVFEHKDVSRPAIREDEVRFVRADLLHRQSQAQILSRETL